MTDVTHYSRWTIDLIKIHGGRLARTTDEVYVVPEGFVQIHSNACNQRWGLGFVSSHEAHLHGVRATCSKCQAMFEAALKPKPTDDDVHIMPDHHLSFCGLCTCTSPELKGAPDAEIKAFMSDGTEGPGPQGSITCPACITVVQETKALMQKHRNSPMGKVLAEVAEAAAMKRVDKRSRR